MVPQDIRVFIAVDIHDRSNLPLGIGHRGDVLLGREGGSVHVPDIDPAVGLVPPQNIRIPIPVEIADAHNQWFMLFSLSFVKV